MPNRTLGERMRTARLEAGLTLEAVANGVAKKIGRTQGLTPQAVQQWEKGETDPSSAAVAAYAQEVGASPEWLLTGLIASKVAGAQYGVSAREGRVVPKIAVSEAIAMRPIEHASEYVHTHFPCSGEAYVIDVFDTRNAPEYLPHIHRVVIDPAETPTPGDMVLARIGGKPVFGKFTRKAKEIVIKALNEDDWDDEMVVASRGDRIVGVMTEHARPRRN